MKGKSENKQPPHRVMLGAGNARVPRVLPLLCLFLFTVISCTWLRVFVYFLGGIVLAFQLKLGPIFIASCFYLYPSFRLPLL
jgi:hypothetical protein